MTRPFKSSDKIPYDPWFDYNIPAAINDTLQCWIATENTAKWSTEVDDTIHSKMYELATGSGLLLKGSESLIYKNVRELFLSSNYKKNSYRIWYIV